MNADKEGRIEYVGGTFGFSGNSIYACQATSGGAIQGGGGASPIDILANLASRPSPTPIANRK